MTAEPQYHTQFHNTHLLLEEGWTIDQIIEFYIPLERRCVRMGNIHSTEQGVLNQRGLPQGGDDEDAIDLTWCHDTQLSDINKMSPLLFMHCTVQQNFVDKER